MTGELKTDLPYDAVGPSSSIPRQDPPPVSNEPVPVYVSDVLNPGTFWIQLVGPDTNEALNELMVILQ